MLLRVPWSVFVEPREWPVKAEKGRSRADSDHAKDGLANGEPGRLVTAARIRDGA